MPYPKIRLLENITIEDARLTIDGRFRFIVSNLSNLTIGISLEFFDEDLTKLTFVNVSNTVPYEFNVDLARLSCQALKSPLWPMFVVLYDAVLKTIMRSTMPGYCVF